MKSHQCKCKPMIGRISEVILLDSQYSALTLNSEFNP
jgi:hypothetical protein